MLPGQKLVENAKIRKTQMRHFGWFSNTVFGVKNWKWFLLDVPSVGSRQLWDNGCHNFMICLGEVVVEVILARHHLTDYWNLMRPFLFHILYYLSFRVSPTPLLLFIFTPTLQRLLALFSPAFRTTLPKVLIFGAKIQIDQNQCVSTTQKIRILRFNSNFLKLKFKV